MLSPEIDDLVCELGAPLERPRRAAFLAAAQSVLAGIPHLGPGLAFRLLKDVQRQHWDPPPDQRVGEPRHYRPSKLASAEPIGETRPDRARATLFGRRAVG
jgi:hypothetical protein